MSTYAYTAVEGSGRQRKGVVEASDEQTAVSQLLSGGLFVVDIRPEEQSKAAGVVSHGRGRVSRSDVAIFTRRLADLSAAGLPLDRVLQVVGEQSESRALSEISEAARQEVRAGASVSQALAKYPKTFNAVYTETLRAGEASGQLPSVATRLADFLETEVTRRSQITAAMIYPLILSCTAIFVVVFLITFVVPRLSGVFHDLGSNLPVTTKILLGVADFVTQNWMLIIGCIVGVVLVYRAWVKTEAGAFARDGLLLRLPMLGKIWLKATVSRFAHVLGTLVYGGVPILEALEIAGMSAGNKVFQHTSIKVAEDVREGRSIADSMRDAGSFPPVLVHMVAIGEETGDLPKMLSRVAGSLDFEVDNGMRRLTALVEPLIVLTMGTFVGFVVLSVLLPIYQAQDLVK